MGLLGGDLYEYDEGLKCGKCFMKFDVDQLSQIL